MSYEAPAGEADVPAGAFGEPSRGGLGILGGSFNPPHRGHVELARHALRELGLARVLLMPTRISPGKPVEGGPHPAHAEHRLRMCELASAGVEGVEACALEIERAGPSYTVDTLRALHGAHPATALTFILGADIAPTLPAWREAAALAWLARFAVAQRVGGPLLAVPERDPPGFSFVRLRMPMIDISSSLVRERARRGLPVEQLVGAPVAAYIAEHRLYRGAEPAGDCEGATAAAPCGSEATPAGGAGA